MTEGDAGLLHLDHLDLQRGDFRINADLRVENGITAIIGPSGAGKSTLLDAIAGFMTPSSGRILWSGADITKLPPGERPVSMVFQDQNLFPHLTTAQNVGLGISPGLKLSAEDLARVDQVLARVGLETHATRKPADLSGGQQSRVALARVLVRDRPVVLLDEPFAALGPSLRGEMLDLVRDTLGHAIILMVTHDPADALRIADTTCVVAEGQAHPPSDTKALFNDPPAALKAYLGS